MNTDKLLGMLLEAIDYSFLQTDGSYDKTLTYPVIDKIQYIKEQLKNCKIMNKNWNKQSEKDLFNEHVDWSSTYYAVIMKDLTEKVVVSYADECYDGAINTHYDFVGDDDEAVDLDEILLWKEIEDPHKEQEAAKWSEEEESMIRCLEGFVKDAWAKAETEHDNATVKKMSNIAFFLKTIKPWKK